MERLGAFKNLSPVCRAALLKIILLKVDVLHLLLSCYNLEIALFQVTVCKPITAFLHTSCS